MTYPPREPPLENSPNLWRIPAPPPIRDELIITNFRDALVLSFLCPHPLNTLCPHRFRPVLDRFSTGSAGSRPVLDRFRPVLDRFSTGSAGSRPVLDRFRPVLDRFRWFSTGSSRFSTGSAGSRPVLDWSPEVPKASKTCKKIKT